MPTHRRSKLSSPAIISGNKGEGGFLDGWGFLEPPGNHEGRMLECAGLRHGQSNIKPYGIWLGGQREGQGEGENYTLQYYPRHDAHLAGLGSNGVKACMRKARNGPPSFLSLFHIFIFIIIFLRVQGGVAQA